MSSNIKLQVCNIEKSFPGVKALDKVNLTIEKGKVHVLCGENGAGKSTLMKIINGILQPDAGQILIDGKAVAINSPVQARNLGISMINQELNFIPEMTVEENFFSGKWPTNRYGKVNWREIRSRARRLLAEENLPYDLNTKLKDLSISDIQLLEIAKAISDNADLIIMDEPTSAISDKETAVLFKKINSLKQLGKSIIYISHKMDEIFEIADEITIMRDGKVIDSKPKDQLDKDTVISLMVGRKLSENFPKENVGIGEEILEVENFTRYGVFQNVNFHIRAGEIVGFAGLVGAGRTEILRSLFGLDPYDRGQIRIKKQAVKIRNPKDSIERGMVMLSEDRRRYGIIPVRSVRENITVASLERFIYKGRCHRKQEREAVTQKCREMNVKTPTIEKEISALSGGNQQKVVLAKWMMNNPDILLLDEPTRGIDVGAKYEIYKLMTLLAGQGKAILMVSSELAELIGVCDRIYVLAEGTIRGELQRPEFSQEAIMKLAVGE
ncbi:sugar ABC transporter ATP-binding protein [Capillibacterium thermochitinicola]|uniref:Sugar ABC transporter ATP-binding protein n=1 Tax=Capillibacterium thermochitinicola TaxID=2699427 RepID=A0A8J6LHI0_9FIRM|nr:sugar ABC transporter ATP-binding protein [Capillibacterium thermochitinicola]MBA2132155.1 sugar ABC transporter ATP-binding protein [Capillibacterium thermochitinicola]